MTHKLTTWLCSASAAALVACGGGGGSDPVAREPALPGFSTATTLQVTPPGSASLPEQPAVVVLSDGDALMAFADTDQVTSRRFDAAATPTAALSAPQAIGNPTGTLPVGLRLKATPDRKTAYAVFVQRVQTQSILFARKYQNGAWGPLEKVKESAIGVIPKEPDLAFDPETAEPSVIWVETTGSGASTAYQVLASRRTAQGWLAAESVFASNTRFELREPRLVFRAGRDRLAAMRSIDHTTSLQTLAIATAAADTGIWVGPSVAQGTFLPVPAGTIASFDLAQGPGGHLALAWEHKHLPAPGRSSILASQLDGGGAWSAFKVVDNGGSDPNDNAKGRSAINPALTLDSNGVALVVWEEFLGSTSTLGILATRRSLLAGTRDGEVHTLASADAGQNLFAAPDGDGNVMVAWSKFSLSDEAKAARFDAGLGKFSPAQLVGSPAGEINLGTMALAVSPKGRSYVLWRQGATLFINHNGGPLD